MQVSMLDILFALTYTVKYMSMKKVCVLVGFVVFLSCDPPSQQEEQIREEEPSLFTILGPEDTGIGFVNYLKEGERMNGLFYEYFYNGGGVAVGDVNNDGLQDIYFTSNLESNKLYLNEGEMKFRDVTPVAGVRGKYGFSTGTTMVDINQDGWMDIYVCKSGQFNDPNKRRNELWVNQGLNASGIPTFVEQAATYGLDCPQFSTQVAFFDYDRDNDLDMFLINHGIKTFEGSRVGEMENEETDLRGERLFENRNGYYHDVTEQAQIINNNLGYCLGLGIGDFNNDDWPDVYVSVDYSGRDHLYLNQKDGTFEESILKTTGHISNFSMGNDIADVNNDGKQDIMVVDMASESYYDIKTSMGGMNPKKFNELVRLGQHHQYMFNTLQLNRGVAADNDVPRFSDIAQMSGVSSSDWSWAPLLLDMDNDGFKDLFVSNGIKRDFRNNDFVIYRKKQDEKAKALILAKKKWDVNTYVEDLLNRMPSRKKPNNFYLNKGGMQFAKLVESDLENASFASNGSAYADFDNDGDLDLVVNNSDDPAIIYQNNTQDMVSKNFLRIRLSGPKGNVNGLGTKIELESNGQKQYAMLYTSRGFQSSVTNEVHFGLGKNTSEINLKVKWPDGKMQYLEKVSINQRIVIDYSKAIPDSHTEPKLQPIFSDITSKTVQHTHEENAFDDFERESLLPHQMSRFGPALAVADINSDGLDDFFVGGAKGVSGTMYIQNATSTFVESHSQTWLADKESEDVGALFFDADGDGDNDLYVVSGGNEFENQADAYQDRLYLNDGFGGFKKSSSLPVNKESGSRAVASDFDGDGDLDLLVGGRQTPGQYPLSTKTTLLRNVSNSSGVRFEDVTDMMAPELSGIGMVTDVGFTDFNGDNLPDILVVGEWMHPVVLIQDNGRFVNQSEKYGLAKETGWWFSTATYDFDGDGDMDFIAGNLGANYKYHASPTEPFEVFANDFDGSGSLDIVLGYEKKGNKYPLRGRECSSNQMPFIKEKFPTYDQFAQASLQEVYGTKPLAEASHYSAHNFQTTYFENVDGDYFKPKILTDLVQMSAVNGIELSDVNEDGHMDVLLAGNLFVAEVETVRSDAGLGVVLIGDGKGDFKALSAEQSGLYLSKDVKDIQLITLGKDKRKGLLVANNDDKLQVIRKNN